MSFLFGNLTESFVTFGTAVANANAGSAEAQARIMEAAAHVRHKASNDSLYLVVIGKSRRCLNMKPFLKSESGIGLFVCTFVFMSVWVYTGEASAKRLREQYLRSCFASRYRLL